MKLPIKKNKKSKRKVGKGKAKVDKPVDLNKYLKWQICHRAGSPLLYKVANKIKFGPSFEARDRFCSKGCTLVQSTINRNSKLGCSFFPYFLI